MAEPLLLPDDIAERLAPHLKPLSAAEIETAARSMTRHLEEVRNALKRNEFLDIELAERVVTSLRVMVDEYETLSLDARAAVGGAFRYFLDHDDAESDLESAMGFDDDAVVVSAVARAIGRPDLVVLP